MQLADAIGAELKEIIEMAFDHPEARTIRTVAMECLRDRPYRPPPRR